MGNVRLHGPEGASGMRVIVVADDAAPGLVADLAAMGASVVAVSAGQAMRVPAAGCPLDALERDLATVPGLPAGGPTLLIGITAGAPLARALASAARPGAVRALITLGYCPSAAHAVDGGPALLTIPWIELHGDRDQRCNLLQAKAAVEREPAGKVVTLPGVAHDPGAGSGWLEPLRDAYLKLLTATTDSPVSSATLAGLPLAAVPARGPGDDRLAVLLTGDGGWAGLDRELAGKLAAAGMPVVALSTLNYFWRERAPREAASDLARIMAHYLAAWHKRRVVLIGYSFGANVLPFLVPELPDSERARVAAVALLAPATHASFEIHVADWIPGSVPEGRSLGPQLARLRGIPVLCLYGKEETDSLCPHLPADGGRAIRLPGGHHFNDDSATLAAHILSFPPP